MNNRVIYSPSSRRGKWRFSTGYCGPKIRAFREPGLPQATFYAIHKLLKVSRKKEIAILTFF